METTWTQKSHIILEQATGLNHYNRWIISLFKGYFRKNILEIGSGLGGLSLYLPKTEVTLSDNRLDYFNYLKNISGFNVMMLDIEKNLPKKLINSFNTIISSNVFEHINDDLEAMKNCNLLLKKNGKLLLFVPARPEIFGILDKSMGHYRRYTKNELINKTEKAGFKIIKIKYVNLPGYFSWYFRGKLVGKSSPDNFFAKLFDTLVVPFLYLEKYLSVPFGQSLMLIAQK